MDELLTLSDLRKLTGAAKHVLNHAIDRFGPEPSGRIGIARVWTRDTLPRILESLAKTQANNRSTDRGEEVGAE